MPGIPRQTRHGEFLTSLLVLIVLAERQMDNSMHAAGMVPEARIGKYTPIIDADGQRL